VAYKSEALARDGAAMKAFMICRNFSSNNGMLPGQRTSIGAGGGVVQGLPVPIGAGRRSSSSRYEPVAARPSAVLPNNRHSTTSSSSYGGYDTSSDGLSSGGNSPKSLQNGLEEQQQQQQHHRRVTPYVVPRAGSIKPSYPRQVATADDDFLHCLCRRGPVRAYGRCRSCLVESGWA